MEDSIKTYIKKYILTFLLFYFFYLSIPYLFSGIKASFFDLFKFITSFCFFLLFKLSEQRKEYIKEIPFVFFILFIFSIPLFKNVYFLKKFFFIFTLTPFVLRLEIFKSYLKKNFIFRDIFYSVLYLYILFLILPYKFPFFPELWVIFTGFFLLEFLKYFSLKINFPFEEKKGIMTYSKYMGFYTSLFFMLSIYFSIFFLFLSFWRGCNFTFLFPLILLFALLKSMLFIFIRILRKQSRFSEFLGAQSVFFKSLVYTSFIVESILYSLNISFLKI